MLKVDKAREKEIYSPSGKEEEILNIIRQDWVSADQQRQRPWRQLRYLSIEDFMQRLRDHYNGHVEEFDEVEQGWRSNIFKRKSRHKVMAVVAQFVSAGLGVEISARDIEQRLDRALASTINDIYDWTLEREDFSYKFMRGLLEMVITGTAHFQEEIAWDEREVNQIEDIDFETGKIKSKKETRTTFKGCRLEFVPNIEIYPGDVWIHDPQEQPFYIRRKITTYQHAESIWSNRDNWDYVKPGLRHFLGDEESESDRDDEDFDNTDVEVIYYWNKSEDMYHVVLNGVLITDTESPIPYPHKNYPIVKSIYEPFADSRFYYGDSLVNKNYDEQEMINVLNNSFVDSTRLSTFPPLLSNNAELANTDIVIPGVQVAVDVDDEVRTIPEIARGVSSSEFNMMTSLERQIDENSIDPLLAGQAPQGDPTATEIRAIAGSAERIKELNEMFVASLLIQIARLRIPNLLWFLTHDEEYKKIVLNKTEAGRKAGKKIIRIVDATEIPTPEEILLAETELESKGQDTNFVFVDGNKVNDYMYHVQLATRRKPTRNDASRLSRIFTKYRIYSQNPIIDQGWNTEQLLQALGDDPEEAIQQMQAQPEQAKVGLPPGSPQLEKQLTQEEDTLQV